MRAGGLDDGRARCDSHDCQPMAAQRRTILLATSAAWTISFCVLIAQGVPRDIVVPERNPDQEMRFMLVGLAVVVLVIVATVLITGLFWMSVVRRRSRA